MNNCDYIIENSILTGYTGNEGILSLPEGIKSIGARTFYGCTSLRELILPEGLEVIEESAFFGCSALSSIVFPGSLKVISNHAFAGCSSLKTLSFSEGLKRIEQSAFSPCALLKEIRFPNSLEYIGEFAFSCCRALSDISFSDPLKTIDRSAFSMCSSLDRVSLPKELTSISRGVFLGCFRLKEVDISVNVSSVENSAFSGCSSLVNIKVDTDNPFIKDIDGVLYSRDGKCLKYFPGGRLEIVIPEGVLEIGDEAFYENHNFDRISLPSSLTSIGDRAFYGCSELLNIEFPDTLESLGQSSFERCSALTGLTLPSGITQIKDSAFRSCKGLMWLAIPENIPFDLHWFCAPNDPPCYSADHTIIPFVTTRNYSDITSEIGKRRAALGMIMAENAGIVTDPYISASYIDYIRAHADSYYDDMLNDDSILRWLTGHRLIPEEDVERLLENASSMGRASACAILLDYQSRRRVTVKSAPSISLDERFDALANALDDF